jgi:putative lipoic acid-binding regulatory protein
MTDSPDKNARETLLEFPCRFPIKMMGRDREAFHAAAKSIIERHYDALAGEDIRQSMSRNANFVSLTITINASSQAQLDLIYEELSAHEEILVAL